MADLARVYYDGLGVYPDLAMHAAAMSYWAYQSHGGSNATVAAAQGLSNVLYYDDPDPDVPFMLAGFDGLGWQIAVAGSTQIPQWMRYISRAGVIQATGLTGSVFKPFNQWSDALLIPLLARISNTQPVALTGHSLGGALAILLAEKLRVAGKQVKAVCTFGCPRVGDVNFARAAQVPIHNVRTLADVIPHSPPPLVPVVAPLFGVGPTIPQLFRPGYDYILPVGRGETANIFRLVSSTLAGGWVPQLAGTVIHAHLIERYVLQVWAAISDVHRQENRFWETWLRTQGNLPLSQSRAA